MNNHQLEKMGVPKECFNSVIAGIQVAAKSGELRNMNIKKEVALVLASPELHREHTFFADFAALLIEEKNFVRGEPIGFNIWGKDTDPNVLTQMKGACSVPSAVSAAIMADSHLGYFLPIGGVLATEGTIIPYAVGVDIACRMKLSVLDLPLDKLNNINYCADAIEKGTVFGTGKEHEHKQNHSVMDQDWNITKITRENKDKAWRQLGTSGSGNHFINLCELVVTEQQAEDFNLAPGKYVAILTHSGSRGVGASVCNTYSTIAKSKLPCKYADLGQGWLDLNDEAGQEYFAAMNLMGDYAAANHDTIHKLVSKNLGAKIIAGVENHHNFAWKEIHNGKELLVHRKGATPAGKGVLGVIPGSMGTPAFVVRGKGNPDSLNSASHGAGRRMSRTKAKEMYTWNAVKQDLAKKGITVLSAGADEVPYAYKDIFEVMESQKDLVDVVAQINPKIVKMSDDGKSDD